MKPEDDFDVLVAPFRGELHAYCYRMLGSLSDADDAIQDALVGAWKGLAGFEGRSALRSWLYRIATNSCLRLIASRPTRLVSQEYGPTATGTDVESMVTEPVWLEPYPATLDASYEFLESVELAFVAALQHLPANQRAALVLRDVLGFEATEVATALDTTVASVTSALQRARETVAKRVPTQSQQKTLRELGPVATTELVHAYVDAWWRRDVDALVALLRKDVTFSMPPIPTWFDGRDSVGRFFAERVFRTPWRLVPLPAGASGQLAFACYQGPGFTLGALNVLTLDGGSIRSLTGFLDRTVHGRFSLPER